jgi:hypothetical protein
MRYKNTEHILSIALVTIIILTLIFRYESASRNMLDTKHESLKPFLEQSFIDLDDPFKKSLLRETLVIYTNSSLAKIDSIITELELYQKDMFTTSSTFNKKNLTYSELLRLCLMYMKFILAYVIVILFTYYAVQTLGVIRFIRFKQNRESYLAELIQHIQRFHFKKFRDFNWAYYQKALVIFFKALAKGISSLILFAPAYVIAYSFRTRFDTDSLLFMIILGVISNGLLITYTQKFFTFLMAEHRKGYVETAIVKNLNNSYSTREESGLKWSEVFALKKRFPDHVFGHIFSNARFQFIESIKEQGAFLITGLIIVEMALNIQGHLCYELLQSLLYKNYSITLLILLGLFLLVKSTEVFVDQIKHRSIQKYENANV